MMFRTNWPTKGLFGRIGRELNKYGNLLNNCEGFGGVQVHATTRGLHVYGGSASGLDLSKFSFGWLSSSGREATIRQGCFSGYSGYIRIGNPESIIQCGGNEAARHLIIVEIRKQGSTISGSIVPNTILESSFSGDTADILRRPLYAVYLDEGEVVMDEILHVGVLTP